MQRDWCKCPRRDDEMEMERAYDTICLLLLRKVNYILVMRGFVNYEALHKGGIIMTEITVVC